MVVSPIDINTVPDSIKVGNWVLQKGKFLKKLCIVQEYNTWQKKRF